MPALVLGEYFEALPVRNEFDIATLTGQGGVNPRTALDATTRYVGEFFDVHLRGASPDGLYSVALTTGVRFETSR